MKYGRRGPMRRNEAYYVVYTERKKQGAVREEESMNWRGKRSERMFNNMAFIRCIQKITNRL